MYRASMFAHLSMPKVLFFFYILLCRKKKKIEHQKMSKQ